MISVLKLKQQDDDVTEGTAKPAIPNSNFDSRNSLSEGQKDVSSRESNGANETQFWVVKS